MIQMVLIQIIPIGDASSLNYDPLPSLLLAKLIHDNHLVIDHDNHLVTDHHNHDNRLAASH